MIQMENLLISEFTAEFNSTEDAINWINPRIVMFCEVLRWGRGCELSESD
jgi:hypothetical protein